MTVAATMSVPGSAAAAGPLARSGALIDARGIVKIYPTVSGEPVLALDRVDMSVDDGEFVCLVGPSGCGKSTLLKVITGIARGTEEGHIYWDERDLIHQDFSPSEIGYVPQFGIAYEDECAVFGLDLRREFTRIQDIQPATSILFTFRLKGIN